MTQAKKWDADYQVSTEMVVTLIETNTNLAISEIRLLGEGWDFFSFLINNEWVFRLPKRWHCADTLIREHELLESLQLSVPIPKHEYWILQPIGFHMPLAGYRHLKGSGLHKFLAHGHDLRQLGKQLGRFLKALHARDFLPKRLKSDPAAQALAERFSLLDDAANYISAEQRIRIEQLFDGYQAKQFVEDHVSTHSDLGVEHILVDADMKLVAIIDWANACSANRYVDFCGLWAWGGDDFVQPVLESYERIPDASDWSFIRLQGLYYILNQLNSQTQKNQSSLFKAAQLWLGDRLEELRQKELDHLPSSTQ